MRKFLLLLTVTMALLWGGEIRWETDYNAAVAKAKAEKKPIFFVLSNHDCKWCKHLEATTFKDAKMIARLNAKFINVIAYADGGDAYPRELYSPATPALWFLDIDGEAMFEPIPGAVGASDLLPVTDTVLKEFKQLQLARRYGNRSR